MFIREKEYLGAIENFLCSGMSSIMEWLGQLVIMQRLMRGRILYSNKDVFSWKNRRRRVCRRWMGNCTVQHGCKSTSCHTWRKNLSQICEKSFIQYFRENLDM